MTRYRVGNGLDAHRLVPGRPLVLGGVTVPYDRVFFAGEATEPVEYGTVHAALWSGEQTAEAVFRAATGVDASRDMRPWAKARKGAGRHNG